MKLGILIALSIFLLSNTTHAKELAGGISYSPEKHQTNFKNLLKFADIPYILKIKHKIEYVYWPQELDSNVQKIKNIGFDGSTFDKATISKILGDYKKYKALLFQAANEGDSEAQSAIGGNYLIGDKPFDKDTVKAKYWLEIAVKNNGFMVAGMLANIYVKENYPAKQIHDTYLIGANAGDQISMCKIAGFYDIGQFLFKKDQEQAKEWRGKSKKSGIDCSFFDNHKK